MAILAPSPKQKFFANDGSPLANGKVYTYAAGTTTPVATYVDSGGIIANTNPVDLDSRGEADIWLLPGTAYKFAVKTSADVDVWTVDDISAADSSGIGNWLTGVTGTNTYSVTGVAGFSSYVTGQVFRFTVPNTNTGASTLNINGKGTRAIRRAASTEMAAGDLVAGAIVEIVYSGANFRVIGLPGSLTFNASGQASAPSFQSFSNFNGPGAAFKNYIINGGMQVNQRNGAAAQSIVIGGATPTPGTALVYTLDRFYLSAITTGAATITVIRNPPDISGNFLGQNSVTITGAANITSIVFGTRLEQADVYQLGGNSVTLSVALQGSLSTLNWALRYAATTDAFGTIAAPTVTPIANGTFTGISSLFASTKSATFTLPATALTAPTGIEIILTTGALGAGQTMTIGDYMLEQGAVATPFTQPPYALELARCQRYFCKTFNVDTVPANGVGNPGELSVYTAVAYAGAGIFGCVWRYPVEMRAAPTTFTYYNPTAGAAGQWGNAGVAPTTVSAGSNGVTIAANLPTIGANARANIHVTASAEIP